MFFFLPISPRVLVLFCLPPAPPLSSSRVVSYVPTLSGSSLFIRLSLVLLSSPAYLWFFASHLPIPSPSVLFRLPLVSRVLNSLLSFLGSSVLTCLRLFPFFSWSSVLTCLPLILLLSPSVSGSSFSTYLSMITLFLPASFCHLILTHQSMCYSILFCLSIFLLFNRYFLNFSSVSRSVLSFPPPILPL
jgi:hypothetical protein